MILIKNKQKNILSFNKLVDTNLQLNISQLVHNRKN